jgi:hypothetical protein
MLVRFGTRVRVSHNSYTQQIVCTLMFRLLAPSVAYVRGDVVLGLCLGRSDKGVNVNRWKNSSSPRKTQLVPFYRTLVTVALAHLVPWTFKSIIKYLVSGLPGSDLWTRGVPVDYIFQLTVVSSRVPNQNSATASPAAAQRSTHRATMINIRK